MGLTMKDIEPDIDPNCTSVVLYNLLRNCIIMSDYIIESGKEMPTEIGLSLARISQKAAPARIEWLGKMKDDSVEETLPAAGAGSVPPGKNIKLPVYYDLIHKHEIAKAIEDDAAELQKIYLTFIQIVAPATPHSIEYTTPTEKMFVKWGPQTIPLMMNMWIVCFLCLVGFVLTQVSFKYWIPFLSGLDFLLKPMNLTFSAGLGAFFYSLYNANKYIINRTFDPKYIPYYLNRIIIGVIAGFILANIIFPGASQSGSIKWNESTIALLGGFSAEAVMKILSRMVAMLITLVEGDTKDYLNNKAAEQKAELEKKFAKQKIEMAGDLSKMATDMRGKVDEKIITDVNNYISKILAG